MRSKLKLKLAIKYFSTILITGMLFFSCGRQVSVTPPDAPAPSGSIMVNSNPEGFQVYLNGKERRRVTPDSITWLSNGTYQITLKKDLFRDSSFFVNVIEGKQESVFIDYSGNASMQGSIFCDSSPEKAEIFLNDRNTGILTPATLFNIIPGNYEVRYHLTNYRDDSVNISVNSGSSSKVSMMLLDTLLWQQYSTDNSLIKTNNLTCIGIDKNDVIWVGTDDQGVLSFNGNTWGGSQIYASLPDKHINCIAVDNNNIMFFGTNHGFVTYDGSVPIMYGFKTSGLPDFTVEAISFDNAGNWYIGTHGGATKSYIINGVRNWYTYGDSMVSDKQITSLLCDNFDNLWVGMNSQGISIINKDVSNWQLINNNNSNIESNKIRSLAESPSGTIWVGFASNSYNGGGLSYYDGTVWHNVAFIPFASQTNAILIDKNNTKWVATDQGLVKITASSNVTNFNQANTSLAINDVTGVAQDSKGNIWISTYGGGLVEYKGNH